METLTTGRRNRESGFENIQADYRGNFEVLDFEVQRELLTEAYTSGNQNQINFAEAQEYYYRLGFNVFSIEEFSRWIRTNRR